MALMATLRERTFGLMETARRHLPTRLPEFMLTGPGSETARAAAAGAILFGIAGAGLGAKGGFAAFRVDAAAAGATVSVGWGYLWLALAATGAIVGASVGAGAIYAGRRWLDASRTGAALLAVGAVGGVLAGATWGSAVARERLVEVRAQHASAAQHTGTRGARVTVVNGPVRLDGNVAREVNVPLLAFMVVGGTVVGALAARGLAEPLAFGRRAAAEPVRADPGGARFTTATGASGAF